MLPDEEKRDFPEERRQALQQDLGPSSNPYDYASNIFGAKPTELPPKPDIVPVPQIPQTKESHNAFKEYLSQNQK